MCTAQSSKLANLENKARQTNIIICEDRSVMSNVANIPWSSFYRREQQNQTNNTLGQLKDFKVTFAGETI